MSRSSRGSNGGSSSRSNRRPSCISDYPSYTQNDEVPSFDRLIATAIKAYPKPYTKTLNHTPKTLNPTPKTLHHTPETLNPTPKTLNPKIP